jgi:polyhydroxyalkanoate synthesis repressor PhaR
MPAKRPAAALEQPAPGPESQAPSGSGPRVLKKYPNRRLYDTRNSSYITLADVKTMVMAHEDFVVRDAKTGEDLTRSILLQIILEAESGGEPMFSAHMLANIIRFYGHAMQGLMGSVMEKNLQTFVDLQKRFAEQSAHLVDPKSLNPDAWKQLMSGQAPLMQNLMGNYLDQSRSVFTQMQEQMAKQAEAFFAGMPGIPGMPGTKPPPKG